MIEVNAVSSSPMADLRRRSKAGAGGARLSQIEPILQANWRRFTLDYPATIP